MMRYLVSVIDDRTGSATPTEMAAIDAFNDRLEAEGLPHARFARMKSRMAGSRSLRPTS
jgi:hypothetical protein